MNFVQQGFGQSGDWVNGRSWVRRVGVMMRAGGLDRRGCEGVIQTMG